MWVFAFCEKCMCHTHVDSVTGMCKHGKHKVLKSAYQKAREKYQREHKEQNDNDLLQRL